MKLPGTVILATLAVNILSLALPLAILQIFDRVLRHQAYSTLILLMAALVCIILAETGLRLARNKLIADLALGENYDMQMRAARRLLSARCAATAKLPPSEAAESIGAVEDLGQFSGGSAHIAMLDLPFVAVFLLVIWHIGGVIVLVPLTLIAIFLIWMTRARSAIGTVIEEQAKRQRERFRFYAECIEGFQTIKALTIEPQIQRRFERMIRSAAPVNYEMILQTNRMVSAGQLFGAITLIAVVTAGGAMALEGQMSIGALAACSIIAIRATQPALRMASVWGQLENTMAALERSQAVMKLPAELSSGGGIAPPASLRISGNVLEIHGKPAKAAGESIVIRRGQVAGILIEDDFRRRDFADLLRGFKAPAKGQIAIDDLDLADEASDSLLRGVLLIDCRPAVFRGTILENMSMFGLVNPAVAIELSRKLGVEKVVSKFPEGYETLIDDVGARQLQQDILLAITVVRAASVRPRLLILDVRRVPPEDVFTRACARLIEEMRGLSTIVLLGRSLADVRGAGQVYVMRNGSLEALPPETGEMAPGEQISRYAEHG